MDGDDGRGDRPRRRPESERLAGVVFGSRVYRAVLTGLGLTGAALVVLGLVTRDLGIVVAGAVGLGLVGWVLLGRRRSRSGP